MISLYKPLLVNAANPGTHPNAGGWTRHEYIGSEPLTIGETTAHQVSGIAHMFKCMETGAIRRYGFDAFSYHGEKDPVRDA